MNELGYVGRRVIVTGCASGIGLATARALGELGAEVHGFDRHRTTVPLASFHPVDLGDPASIDDAVSAVYGPVDALFNCAGLSPMHPQVDVLRVNFLGTRHLTDRVLERMVQGGAIVTTSSNGGLGWRSHLAELNQLLDVRDFAEGLRWIEAHADRIGNAYAYSKEALIVWTLRESARTIRHGIRLNCTSPGAVQTPMLDEIEASVPSAAIDRVAQPFGRRSMAEEQVGPLLFLNSNAAVYVNGVNLSVDGGYAAVAALASS